MTRHLLALAMMLLCSGANAQSPEPPGLSLRMVVSPAVSAWVGQHVAVTIIARTPVRFAGSVVFPDIPIGGRAIVLPNGASTPGVEREDGRTYAVVQHRYDLFPSGTGALTIGPLALTVPIVDDAGATRSQTAEAVPLALSVRLPPGAGDLDRMLTASQVRIDSTTSGNPSSLPVGQPITRTVTLTASDTASMLLPAMPWTAPAGMRVYPDPPRLTDGTDRGFLSAGRIDRATFVPETPGRYMLPGASVQWFNPQDGKMTSLVVEPMEVMAVPASITRQASWRLYLAAAAALAIACGGIGIFLIRNRPIPPERHAYSALRHACRKGNPRLAIRALYGWIAVAGPPGTPRTAAAIAGASGTPSLAKEAGILAARCFGTPGSGRSWSGHGLRHAVRMARSALRGRITGRASRPRPALPDLNPPPDSI